MNNIKKVIVFGDKKLISKSKKIKHFDSSLQHLVQDMIATVDDYNGAGLAAVQIGELRKVAILKHPDTGSILVLINPEIIEQSGTRIVQEGCLSIPGKWGNVKRPETISVKAQDLNGKVFKIKNATGLLAQCLSHELDHLDGLLYVHRLAPEEKNVS